MFFTLEDYRKIEEYLRLNSKKDTDFPTAKTITDDDYVPIIQDAVNKKMSVEDLRIGLSKGPRGESAYECAVRHGYVGTEEEWLASLDGKSAYQIAVELGYVGTEEEWLASLKGKKGDKGDNGLDGKDGKDADVWTIGDDDFWYLNGRKTIYKSKGDDGASPILRISPDGLSLEISSDGGQTWLLFEKNFNRLRVIGYVDSVEQLPRNAIVGDIYGVWNPDVYSGRVDEEGHLIKGAYDLYINTIRDWAEDYLITKVYDYDTELPAHAANGSTVLVPVSYLTLDKEKIDGYKVYRFDFAKDGWTMILNTAEIYASKDDIINYGDNVYALVQGDEEHTYMLYKRVVGWIFFGTNASITYKLVLTLEEGTSTNILSGQAVKDAIAEIHEMYGEYEQNSEFVRVYIDSEGKFLWGIRKSDGAIIYGAGVPPQVKEYIDSRIKGYEDIVAFLDSITVKLPIFYNKKVSIIGDSISTFAGYIPEGYPTWYPHEGDRSSDVTSVNDTWWKRLLNATSSSLEVNASYSGSTASSFNVGFSPRVPILGSPDIIIIALGTNDSRGGVEIGNIDFAANSYDLTKFAPAYIKGIQDTMATYPDARIICVAFDMDYAYQNTIKTIADHYTLDYIYVGDISDIHPNKAEMQAAFERIYSTYTLKGLLSSKVDKENGKSLVDKDFAKGIHYEKNPEFVEVKLDSNDKILEAIYKDGTKLLPSGYNINGVVCKTLINPEFIGVWTDSFGHILAAFKNDGDIYFSVGIPSQIKSYIDEKVGYYIDSPEFINLLLDKDNKILEGHKTNGNKYFGTPIENDVIECIAASNPEFLSLFTDIKNRIISSIDKKLENIIYGGINITEIKRDLDAQVLEVFIDENTGYIYTIENNDSTITLEIDDEWNIYEVKDSTNPYTLSENEDGEVFIEETINGL